MLRRLQPNPLDVLLLLYLERCERAAADRWARVSGYQAAIALQSCSIRSAQERLAKLDDLGYVERERDRRHVSHRGGFRLTDRGRAAVAQIQRPAGGA